MSGNLEADRRFSNRVVGILSDITLADNFAIQVGQDEIDLGGSTVAMGRFYIQIACWRKDAITGEMGMGYGGKGYLSEHMTDSEIIQLAFGLYKGYWEHEARETFQWRERRVFGPHIATEALWEVARRVDVRSAQHVEDGAQR